MMIMSEQINELAAALSKAQGQMGGAKKTSANPFFKSSYADLNECWNTCRKALSDNGLAIVQGNGNLLFPEGTNTAIMEVTTLLTHSSGQWIESAGTVIVGKEDIQGQGSAITYARRYALCAMIGLSQEDDDGNSNVKVITNKDGMCIIGKSGKPLPLSRMSVEQLNKLLEQPEYSEAFEVAKQLLELKSKKDGSVTMADVDAIVK